MAKLIQFINSLPIIRSIPGFNTLPPDIESGSLRFYKLSNLVLTLGMFVHALWVGIFLYLAISPLILLNLISVGIYIFCIVINRKGYHFSAANIMVVEIILHQIIAVLALGINAGFQNYVLVIGLFPFLMPKGRWILKSILLGLCLCTYILLDYFFKGLTPLFVLDTDFITFFKISNILFSFTSMAISGAYFNIAMHETEDSLAAKTNELVREKNKTDELLLNILPHETAEELKRNGFAQPKLFHHVTVLFTDFKNFTRLSEVLNPEELVREIHYYYSRFDEIMQEHQVEKIKTIGDSYMCVAGLPVEYNNNPIHAVKCAMAIQRFISEEKKKRLTTGKPYFDIRIGLHTGSVVAGIVGTKKFAYDIWGDTVNVASRMESACLEGQINISESTYQLVKNEFTCKHRGKIEIKNKGEIDMYFVEESSLN